MIRFFALVTLVVGLALFVGGQVRDDVGVETPAAESYLERATRTRLGEFQVERSIEPAQ
jgi:hypothetical protein